MKEIVDGKLTPSLIYAEDYTGYEMLSHVIALASKREMDIPKDLDLTYLVYQIPSSVRNYHFVQSSSYEEYLYRCMDMRKWYNMFDSKYMDFDSCVRQNASMYSSRKNYSYNVNTNQMCFDEDLVKIHSYTYIGETPRGDYEIDIRVMGRLYTGYKVIAVFSKPK